MSNQVRTIHCARSGVPLVEVTSVCSNGWALLSQPAFTTFVHPIYNLPIGKLCRKLELQLIDADHAEWLLPASHITEISLSMSAIMYSLGSMWLPTELGIMNSHNIEASLPAPQITIGSAGRLLELASWYHLETSRRIKFPLWKPSKHAGTLNWHGFAGWLDACCDLREDWESARAKREDTELLDATEKTLATVHMASVYKRIDINKVWNWIELQAKNNNAKYPVGRRETLKTLFMSGDTDPENWVPDDCDDLIEMVTDTCDIGNDITHYIRTRVSSIRAGINNFYSNFTLIGGCGVDGDGGLELSDTEKTAQTTLFKEYDEKIANATVMPAKPVATDYPSKLDFLKATAEYNILSKRFAFRATVAAASGTKELSSASSAKQNSAI